MPSRAAPAFTVLVVDDDHLLRLMLTRLLEREFTVLGARTAEEGLELMRARPVHVLVADQSLPGMSGVEMLHRAREEFPDTTRMLLTGHLDLSSLQEAVNTGQIYRYLSKPTPNQELLAAVRAGAERYTLLLQNRGLLQQLSMANRELE